MSGAWKVSYLPVGLPVGLPIAVKEDTDRLQSRHWRSVVMTRNCLGLALVLFLVLGTTVQAEQPHDYDTDLGHFYPQAAGGSGGESAGFEISDDAIPFWRTYRWLGGVDVLGYPISRRYEAGGLVYQATQRAILQGDPASRQVRLANTMDLLSAAGRDHELRRDRFVPLPLDQTAECGLSAAEVTERRLNLVRGNARLHAAFAAAPDPVGLLGLPTSEPSDVGPAYAIRFQRGVLYQWKVATPWAAANQVTFGDVGDIAKDYGLIPAAAAVPEPAPAPRRGASTTRGGRDYGLTEGVATWYGAGFHGGVMSDGTHFDMYDSTTAASNTYPLGTLLRVAHAQTGEYIIVRVTDRGGFRYPIVLDLSYAAFGRLADPGRGVIPVRVEPVR
jgi:hypothetical protein